MLLPQDRPRLLKKLIQDNKVTLGYLDTETSPHEGYFWGTGKQYLSYKNIKKKKESKIMTIQWMFEGDSKPSYLTWDSLGGDFDDSSMLEEFVITVLNRPNLLMVGQKHKTFDFKKLNERIKAHKLTPINYQSILKIDVLDLSRSSFIPPSHKLDARSEQYGLGGKINMDWDDWINILEGRTIPEDKMVPYGLKDITDLRSIFWRELPYYEKLPAQLQKLLEREDVYCAMCAERRQRKFDVIEKRFEGRAGWLCNNCGHRWSKYE